MLDPYLFPYVKRDSNSTLRLNPNNRFHVVSPRTTTRGMWRVDANPHERAESGYDTTMS